MAEASVYISTPLGSLVTRSSQEEDIYLDLFTQLPKNLSNTLSSHNTGSFLRGLAKDFQVPLEQEPQIAFAVLRVGVGEVELAKLGATLSAELKLPNDKAQNIAREIEKELFAPVMLELNTWLEKQKQASQPTTTGVSNVLDLKSTNSKTQSTNKTK